MSHLSVVSSCCYAWLFPQLLLLTGIVRSTYCHLVLCSVILGTLFPGWLLVPLRSSSSFHHSSRTHKKHTVVMRSCLLALLAALSSVVVAGPTHKKEKSISRTLLAQDSCQGSRNQVAPACILGLPFVLREEDAAGGGGCVSRWIVWHLGYLVLGSWLLAAPRGVFWLHRSRHSFATGYGTHQAVQRVGARW